MLGVFISLVFGVVQPSGESVVPIVCQSTQDTAAADADTRIEAALTETMCAARERMNALTHLRDSDMSRLALETAVAPTFAVLDDVAQLPSARWQVVAHALRGDLYVEMAARLRHAPGDNDEVASATRVADWLARARAAYADARTIAIAHPELLDNPIVIR